MAKYVIFYGAQGCGTGARLKKLYGNTHCYFFDYLQYPSARVPHHELFPRVSCAAVRPDDVFQFPHPVALCCDIRISSHFSGPIYQYG